MTTLEYYKAKNTSLGIGLSDAQLDAFMLSVFVDPLGEVDASNVKSLDISYLGIILSILVKPDITEGGYSIKFDRKAIMSWYGAEASRLGIKNELDADKIRVVDKSHLA